MAAYFPTQSQKRGFNSQMLRDKIEEYQLVIFHKHFSRDPATLYTELKRHERALNRLRPKILKADQWEMIFPASSLTESSKFDTINNSTMLWISCMLDGFRACLTDIVHA